MQIQTHKSVQQVFGFSSEDLAENRMGRLSPAQRAQIRRGARQLLFISLALLTTLAILVLVVANPERRELQVLIIGFILLAAFILVDTVGIAESSVMGGVIARVSGVAYVSNEDSYIPPVEHPFNYHHVGKYSPNNLYVEEEQFQLTKQQCNVIPQGSLVDVYYIPALHKIVAIDIIKVNDVDDLADSVVISNVTSKVRFVRDDMDDVEPMLG